MRIRRPKGQRKTTCSGCGIPVEETRKGQRYCKNCHAKHQREHRKFHSELNPIQKLKANCRAYANTYLNRGNIEKKTCEICGDENSQMHHDDYNKPLEIKWLCRKHHLRS